MTDILDLQIVSPIFGGSTGGWLRAAETEEKYAITWTSKNDGHHSFYSNIKLKKFMQKYNLNTFLTKLNM